MSVLSILGRSATLQTYGGNGQRMIFTAVQAFQREVSSGRHHRNSVGAASFWPLSSTSEETAGTKILTNQDLVERRLAVNRGKRAAKERSARERESRNLNIKRLLHSDSGGAAGGDSSEFQVPTLYAVKVWVDDELRDELKLSGREKRGRAFIEAGTEGTKTFRGMKDELFGFFRALRKDTFLLTANLPKLDEQGNVVAIAHPSLTENDAGGVSTWTIENDEDVVKTFAIADDFFKNSGQLKRPSVQINVRKIPTPPSRHLHPHT